MSIQNKRKIPMIKEYEDIYQDWHNEIPQFTANTPVTWVVLEMHRALRRVMQGTTKSYPVKENK